MKQIAAFIAGTALLYLVGAFIAADWDFRAWQQGLRVFLALLFIVNTLNCVAWFWFERGDNA